MGIGARRIPRVTTQGRSSRPLDAAHALRQLLNPLRRAALALPARRYLIVAAVWPDGPGFSARLESPRQLGMPVVWVRWRDAYEVWPFPEDPELSALADLVDQGFSLLGHRLGRRAALLSPDEGEIIYLRPPRSSQTLFFKLRKVHEALQRCGIRTARLGGIRDEIHGMRAERVEGDPTPKGSAPWGALGEKLARVHAMAPPVDLAERGPGMALDACVRQVGIAILSGDSFTQWLERRLGRWQLMGATFAQARGALVHGDLHPAQVIWDNAPVILDWEQAGIGDPEEDLGNLAAHLYWDSGPMAALQFAALKEGYLGAGGRVGQPLFEHYARLALVRVLAVHALREADQTLIRRGRADWVRWPEVVSSW